MVTCLYWFNKVLSSNLGRLKINIKIKLFLSSAYGIHKSINPSPMENNIDMKVDMENVRYGRAQWTVENVFRYTVVAKYSEK